MAKFILLTFGFLGWAFYEMSGGADFVPISVEMAALQEAEQAASDNQAEDTDIPREVTRVAAVPEKTRPVDTAPPGFETQDGEEMVTRVALDLTSLNSALGANEEAPATAPAVEGNVISSGDTPAIIPSLIVPNDTGIVNASLTTDAGSTAGGDIRSVSGNRVNVRGGPGTEFDVVSKLGRGDDVEVLQDNGDGWVLMRPLEGGPEGWMADFLLTNG